VIGLRAGDFWALSLPEWRALCAARFPRPPSLSRGSLNDLLSRYPDKHHG